MAKARRNKDTEPLSDSTSTAATVDADPHSDDAGANGDSRERIAARAYELYLARGGADGQDWDDWLAAERELADNQRRSEPGE